MSPTAEHLLDQALQATDGDLEAALTNLCAGVPVEVIASDAFKAEVERAVAELRPPMTLAYDPVLVGQAIARLMRRAAPVLRSWTDPRKGAASEAER
jgi:hypothetical protein